MFGKMLTISTDKSLSKNYASATRWTRVVKSIHFWSDTKYSKRNTADFHGDGYFLQNAGTSKDLRIALKVCVMLTLNTVVFKLILLYLKKRHCNHTPNPLYFQRCRFTSWDVSRHFMHTIFPANRFVTPTHIVTAVTPVTAHSRNQ